MKETPELLCSIENGEKIRTERHLIAPAGYFKVIRDDMSAHWFEPFLFHELDSFVPWSVASELRW